MAEREENTASHQTPSQHMDRWREVRREDVTSGPRSALHCTLLPLFQANLWFKERNVSPPVKPLRHLMVYMKAHLSHGRSEDCSVQKQGLWPGSPTSVPHSRAAPRATGKPLLRLMRTLGPWKERKEHRRRGANAKSQEASSPDTSKDRKSGWDSAKLDLPKKKKNLSDTIIKPSGR